MSEAGVSMTEPGVLRLAGVLDYRSGPALRKEGKALIAACRESRLVFDCSSVAKSSSVGLSCCWASSVMPRPQARAGNCVACLMTCGKSPGFMTSMKCWRADGSPLRDSPSVSAPHHGLRRRGAFCMMADPRALGAD